MTEPSLTQLGPEVLTKAHALFPLCPSSSVYRESDLSQWIIDLLISQLGFCLGAFVSSQPLKRYMDAVSYRRGFRQLVGMEVDRGRLD